jgi:SAM-dependent methyltransferase
MPRIMKTVIPRIRRSLRERGTLLSLGRSVLLPVHLFQEYRKARRATVVRGRSEFDVENGLNTDGDVNGWTHLSDLEIPGANWIYGRNYVPIEPERFRSIASGLAINYGDFVFVDFGSGKGRALLLASEFPFRRVMGVEFSPELHRIAQENIAKHANHRMSGPVESICMDFLDFPLPAEPLVLFLFDPCEDPVLVKVLARIRKALETDPRPAYLIYVAPTDKKKALLDVADWLVKIRESTELNSCVYRAVEPASRTF